MAITVAIVEDREEIRRSLQQLIQTTDGYTVTGSYSSMEEAIPGVSQAMPDAVVIDIGLPGMSGIEGIRLLRARYPALAMMVLTVFDDDGRIFEAVCAGAQGYLLKHSSREADCGHWRDAGGRSADVAWNRPAGSGVVPAFSTAGIRGAPAHAA